MSEESGKSPKKMRRPITNCHTHIFTGQYVPPYLAKTIVPWPFYLFIHIGCFIWILKKFRKWFRSIPYRTSWQNRIIALKVFWSKVQRNVLFRTLIIAAEIVLSINILINLLEILLSHGWVSKKSLESIYFFTLDDFLTRWSISWGWKDRFTFISILILMIIVSKRARKLFSLVLGKIWGITGLIPGDRIKELWSRYRLIIRFTLYGSDKDDEDLLRTFDGVDLKSQKSTSASGQVRVFYKLAKQYPAGTRFVILPMDMEYMGAGSTTRECLLSKLFKDQDLKSQDLKPGQKVLGRGSFHKQMEEVLYLKSNSQYSKMVFPFVFVDPRRIREEGKSFFSWEMVGERIVLHDCLLKEYLERGCAGIKIYPALGYYPFDEDLLPLWLYCEQNKLPIMTHCVNGVIHYRGRKKSEWYTHPILRRYAGMNPDGIRVSEPLPLLDRKAKDFQDQFTHPLNYYCMMEPLLLAEWVKKCSSETKQLFGLKEDGSLKRNLAGLKICLAHYGGAEEFKRFHEQDTSHYDQRVFSSRKSGIFDLGVHRLDQATGEKYISWKRLQSWWDNTSWYAIITSLMMRFENVYTDISHTLHDPEIYPLLSQTMSMDHDRPRRRILFGTDFFVVRNYNSDKELFTNVVHHLSEEHFDLIARDNPNEYLSR